MISENEPNNSIATAQAVNLGFDSGEVQTLTISGRISGTPGTTTRTRNIDSENNGSITQADETGLVAGRAGSVRDSSVFISTRAPGSSGRDTDLFRVSSEAGQILTIDADGLGFDPIIFLYNAEGDIVAFNDDRSFFNTDAFVEYVVPVDGDYYVAIQHFATFQEDPFDADSGILLGGSGGLGPVDLTISQTLPDVDYYSVELSAGDIVGAASSGGGDTILVNDPSGQLIFSSSQNLTSIYGSESELAGDSSDNATAGFVAPVDGTYTIAVSGSDSGNYDLDLTINRPELEGQRTGSVQYVYLDFDGASVSRSVFGGGTGTANLSGLSTFLDNWGLTAGREDEVIDAIVERFEDLLVTQIADANLNADFGIEVLNSRDHADFFGQENVSRVIIGGTTAQLGIDTLGIAQNVDIGNFDTSDQAVVLLDILSGPSNDSNSVNSLSLASGVSRIDAIGSVVGGIAAHEAGHLLGMVHTNPRNDTISLGDAGGVLLTPTGDDGIFGNADDPDFSFVVDNSDPLQGIEGRLDNPSTFAFGATTGTAETGLLNEFLDDRVSFIGDAADDRLIIGAGDDVNLNSAFWFNENQGINFSDTVGTITIDAGDGDNFVLVDELLVTASTTITAGSGDDRVFGGAGSDRISTGAGDDILVGGFGADILDGGDGIDTLSFSIDRFLGNGVTVNLASGVAPDGDIVRRIENVVGTEGDDSIIGNSRDNVLTGDEGADILNGGGGFDTANYNTSSSSVTVDLTARTATGSGQGTGDRLISIEGVVGSNRDDEIIGNGADNRLDGGAGNDTLVGGRGADEIIGGNGIDRIFYTNSSSGIQIDLETGEGSGGDAEGDTISSVEHVNGSAFADVLIGTTGRNQLIGGQGDDILRGGAGNDLLNGGSGIDTASYANSTAGADINLATNSATGFDHGAGDTLISIESVLGSQFDDSIRGNSQDNILDGGNGADALNGGDGQDTASYGSATRGVIADLANSSVNSRDAAGDTYVSIEILSGSNFDDNLRGTEAANTLRGGDGNDQLFGRGGDDILEGGLGADRLFGSSGTDAATYENAAVGVLADLSNSAINQGEATGDTYSVIENLIGSDHIDRLRGTDGANELIGGDGDDILNSRGGADVLNGGAGADRLFGGLGTDTASYEDAATGVIADLDNSTVNSGEADGDLYSSIEGLTGSDFNDNLRGTNGSNTLQGGGGDDQLFGRAGNDILEGGEGADRLFGSSGIDAASYANASGRVVADLNNSSVNTADAAGDTYSSIENLAGTAFGDNLRGTDTANTLSGGEGADQLFGRGGNDVLEGGEGGDQLFGSSGIDTASYANAAAGVLADLNNTSVNRGDADGDTYSSIENISGSDFDDNLRGTDGVNTLEGGRGADRLFGRDGADTLIGGAGDDVLFGGSGADSFAFGRNDGDDTISSFQNGIDVIDFSGINLAFGNLNITDDGTDTTVDYGTGSITILGTLQSQIDQDDFIFA